MVRGGNVNRTFAGLPDRDHFMDALANARASARRDDAVPLAVLFVGVDRFKHVNYTLGHRVGDALLKGVAARIEDVISRAVSGHLCEATLAHLGGDEFAILLERITEATDTTRIARAILDAFVDPQIIGEHELFTSVSIGIAVSSERDERPEDLLRSADTAMGRAKAMGRGVYVVFEPSMLAGASTALRTEIDLRRALQLEELCVYYQPIVALRSGRITGFEALVRWQHPAGPIIAPGEYIAVAEQSGLVIPMDRFVLRQACRQIQQWNTTFKRNRPLTMSVNFSGLQFTRPDTVMEIDRALRDGGVYGSVLKLEITESVMMERGAFALEILRSLKDLGVRLSIDDFGTGYSSLSYLRRFEIDTLKIDRSFVANIDSDGDNLEIIRAVVSLSHSLSKNVVAEGIETERQRELLLDLRCGFGQGYLFAPPVDVDAATELLVDEQRGTSPFGK